MGFITDNVNFNEDYKSLLGGKAIGCQRLQFNVKEKIALYMDLLRESSRARAMKILIDLNREAYEG